MLTPTLTLTLTLTLTWLTAMASLFEMIGHTASMMVALLTSCERVSGEETMAHAAKCVAA